MKQYLKLFGMEILYLLVSALVAGVAYAVQFIARKYVGSHSSFIFAGNEYRYNPIFYVMGMVLFIAGMILLYDKIWKKWTKGLAQKGIAPKLIWVAIAFVFTVLLLVELTMVAVVLLGFGDNMMPDILFLLTHFGWPMFYFVFMIGILIANRVSRGEADSNS